MDEYLEYVPLPACPVVCRDRERDAAIDAEREDRREDGGAYSEGASGGYGSTISTSCNDDVPKPAAVHVSIRADLIEFVSHLDTSHRHQASNL